MKGGLYSFSSNIEPGSPSEARWITYREIPSTSKAPTASRLEVPKPLPLTLLPGVRLFPVVAPTKHHQSSVALSDSPPLMTTLINSLTTQHYPGGVWPLSLEMSFSCACTVWRKARRGCRKPRVGHADTITTNENGTNAKFHRSLTIFCFHRLWRTDVGNTTWLLGFMHFLIQVCMEVPEQTVIRWLWLEQSDYALT